MANNPRKMKDPTEAALSAIQDALNLREPAPDPTRPADGTPSDQPGSADHIFGRRPTPTPQMDEDLFRDEARLVPPSMDETPSSRRAANDDRQSVGQILQALQQRPSRTPYLIAVVLSLLWAAVTIATAFTLLEADPRALVSQGGIPLFGLAMVVVLPIMFFIAIAHVVVRAQELRLIARSMTQVAMRLGEPDTIAGESVVSVGQAIRREVAAMGDGVERALARAAELEVLVHNEVAALERSYNDNELRIRGLIEDLATQREALVNQADQVRNALSNVHFGLTQDITSVSELVSGSVNDAAQRITRSLAEKGEHITLALGRAGDFDDRRDRRPRRRPARPALAHRRGSEPHARRREHAADLGAQLQDRRIDRQDRRHRGRTVGDAVVAARPHRRRPRQQDHRARRHAGASHRGDRLQPDQHHGDRDRWA